MTRITHTFGRCTSGSTAVEFSLIIAPLLLLLLGAMQFALYSLESQRLSNAVYDIASVKNDVTREGHAPIAQLICRQLSLVESCTAKLRIQLAPVTQYPSVRMPVASDLQDPGAAGDMMLIRVEADLQPFIPWVGSMPLRASALFVRS